MNKYSITEISVTPDIKCDLCAASRFETLFDKGEGRAKILKCRQCGLVFVYPQSNNQGLESCYQNETVVSENDLRRLNKKIKHLNSAIGKIILKEFYGYRNIYDGNFGILEKIIALFAWSFFSKNIIPFRGEGKILDIGCSAGLYLALLKNIGWETYGVEVNKFACDYAAKQGIKVFCGSLEKANLPAEFFDCVRLTHVLEHVSSPAAIFAEINRILKPGGIIYLETPNQKSFAAGCFKENWLGPGGHLFAFSPATLGALCARFGLTVRKIGFKSSKGIMLDSLRYLWKSKFNRQFPERLLKNKLFYVPVIRSFFVFLNLIHRGDTITVAVAKEQLA